MGLPISFDEVPYFKNQFRGDLIITHGVIYYFPHTNVAAERLEKRGRGSSAQLSVAAELVGGHVDVIVNLVSGLVYRVADARDWLTRATTNNPRLSEAGMWDHNLSSKELQSRLDAYVADLRSQTPRLTDYQYSCPRPMRFTRQEINHINVRLLWLRFDSLYDKHDFTIGFRRRRVLQQALIEAGFLKQGTDSQ